MGKRVNSSLSLFLSQTFKCPFVCYGIFALTNVKNHYDRVMTNIKKISSYPVSDWYRTEGVSLTSRDLS
jgi:hypothetical protein